MRCAGARAAALLLVLVLGTAGCGLVDSLTPFGVGTQDYGSGVQNVNGDWEGSTASGGKVTFQVGNDKVLKLHVRHVVAEEILSFKALTSEPLIVDGVFTIDLPLETQGRFTATGTFTSANTCSGTYFFEALPAGNFPTTGSGTFSAVKIF